MVFGWLQGTLVPDDTFELPKYLIVLSILLNIVHHFIVLGDEIFVCIIIYRTSEFHMVGCLGLG